MRVAYLLMSGGLTAMPALAVAPMQDGSGLLRMCQGAEKVRALGVMCHSYLNGYLDTVAVYEKKAMPFCIAAKDKERLPTALVDWIRRHPAQEKVPAPQVLGKALAELHPCKGKR